MARYIVFNGAKATTAAQVRQAFGTSLKTQLQVKPPERGIYILEWGVQIFASVTPGPVELIVTDVAATSLTGVSPTPYGEDREASQCVSGSSATGFGDGDSGEGSIGAADLYDMAVLGQLLGYVHQFPLGREPFVPKDKFLRVRTDMDAAVDGYIWILFEE